MAQPYFRATQIPAVLLFSAQGRLRIVVTGRDLPVLVGQYLPPADGIDVIVTMMVPSGGRS